ncbi:T9SS type A sorting domain-containing protein, partial [Draconibacterium sp.]|nr:T9SS type A sorting domain-containing protein [Draconibacterium sp.]
EMPVLNNFSLLKSSIIQENIENELKPLKFAHAFEVDFSPENSGQWHKTVEGLNCWELKIRSKGAESINLIFDHFMLPPNSRLFIYNEKEDHFLGAYTADNNKGSGKFAISPVAGDEITVHYEVSDIYKNKHPFTIKSVNHDFIGILKSNGRRPMGTIAGECNIDINCDLGNNWQEVKNSVCRMIVNGVEICSGALINNTSEDQKPYIISAAHCYDKWEYAETTVYTFNYESPFCAPLDGDPSNSISGAIMKAQFDSLDFALTELSVIPPPEFRPYYAGWDRSVEISDSTVSIHHPQGDIKKMAFDEDTPEISDFNSKYTKNGFLKIQRWEEGVTEVGSSGGPLFNKENSIVGTLTGGVATCSNPVLDYFQRFSLSWNYKSDSAKQLKCWLDPLNNKVESLPGKQFYEDEDYCGTFTNLVDSDSYDLVEVTPSGESSGYWGGSNSVGITEFVEQFSIYGNEQLAGISLGVGKIHKSVSETNSTISVKVYNGSNIPEEEIYSKNILIRELVDGAMNFIGFDEIIEPNDTFFVGFEISNVQAQDSFVVYQSLRSADMDNYFCYKQNGVWQNFGEVNQGFNSMVNVFELVACNIEDSINKTPNDRYPDLNVYPNPTSDLLTLTAKSQIALETVSVLNLIGQKVDFGITKVGSNQLEINLAGNVPGIYFIRLETSNGLVAKKISFVPW